MSVEKTPPPNNWWVQCRVCEVRDGRKALKWRIVIFIAPATDGQPADQAHFLSMNFTAANAQEADQLADRLAAEQGHRRITHRRSETLSCVWRWSDYWQPEFTPAPI
ncbi:MAG TPA: hypothetical protein VLI90_13165 [Tepidisphaeraceae bacterium]|nr:hypothetical protein [Tepidisphaeraceae bacterium]